ncbi:hypothetical protein [Halomarina pelagica]|uniref:hypothetical protein n=1 Tax=Halomarina pelagica TaxID=2961599 RepID=UPI0020C4B60A|nr:hypothetical protein [Halomarina sp. BND7]
MVDEDVSADETGHEDPAVPEAERADASTSDAGTVGADDADGATGDRSWSRVTPSPDVHEQSLDEALAESHLVMERQLEQSYDLATTAGSLAKLTGVLFGAVVALGRLRGLGIFDPWLGVPGVVLLLAAFALFVISSSGEQPRIGASAHHLAETPGMDPIEAKRELLEVYVGSQLVNEENIAGLRTGVFYGQLLLIGGLALLLASLAVDPIVSLVGGIATVVGDVLVAVVTV